MACENLVSLTLKKGQIILGICIDCPSSVIFTDFFQNVEEHPGEVGTGDSQD